MPLSKLREIIDQIDEKIVQLLNERCKIAGEVGVWKIENGHPIFVPEREKQLFAKLREKNKGPLSSDALTNIYREIISGAIAVEQPLKIAYCTAKTESPIKNSARLTFGDSAEYIQMESISQIFSAVENNDCHYGVVPFYDGKEVFEDNTVDALLKTTLNIVAERISLFSESTSLIVGEQSPVNTGDDRTAFRFEISKDSDNIKSILEILKNFQVGLICCELRISQGNSSNNLVLMEIGGHPAEEKVKAAIAEIEENSINMNILGGYPLL